MFLTTIVADTYAPVNVTTQLQDSSQPFLARILRDIIGGFRFGVSNMARLRPIAANRIHRNSKLPTRSHSDLVCEQSDHPPGISIPGVWTQLIGFYGA